MLGHPRIFLKHMDRTVLRRAVLVAAVIGPTILVVNHGLTFYLDGKLGYGQLFLTLLIPFTVSCFSGVLSQVHGSRTLSAQRDAMMTSLAAISKLVEQIETNAVMVNKTVKARFEETCLLLEESRTSIEEHQNGKKLASQALTAIEEMSAKFVMMLKSEQEMRSEIERISVSTRAVNTSVSNARDRFGLIATLAFEISRIGQQTKLLSLNAAVVAATAGSEGKPFATIADAIRKLAQETEIQAQSINSATQELQTSAVAMQKESVRLESGMECLLVCSDVSSESVQGATSALNCSSQVLRETITNLSLLSRSIGEVTQGIHSIVDHAGAAIGGRAKNAELAKIVQFRMQNVVA